MIGRMIYHDWSEDLSILLIYHDWSDDLSWTVGWSIMIDQMIYRDRSDDLPRLI